MDGNVDRAIDHIARAIANLERLLHGLARSGHAASPPTAIVTAWICRLERQMEILRQERIALSTGDMNRSHDLFWAFVGVARRSASGDRR